ncbi:4-coumarate--CoA ligase-like 9 [Silene latifolia]|uniref:4-coumarate--CoA ligase-like 9 n=1 Tax=Silene latifolia TaxID=37657 RepID=UPI003D782BCC
MDPHTGYSTTTKTYTSLRPPIPLPPRATPLSITQYVLSLLHVSPHFSPSLPFLISPTATSTSTLSYADFLHRVDSLARALSPTIPSRAVALVLSPPSFHLPVIYFSLLSLNVVVSPANPLSTSDELTHLVSLSNPSVVFTVSSLLPNLSDAVRGGLRVILLDSPKFESMLTRPSHGTLRDRVAVSQDDSAVILYSSGTTGRVKGVELTHRNLIALIAGYYYRYLEEDEETKNTRAISLVPLPFFHVFGFSMILRAVSLSETLVMMERFDFEKMLAAVEKFRVTYMPVSPPLIVVLSKSELVSKYDFSSIKRLGCGGAPLGKEVAERFKARFPDILIIQGYGLTETSAGGARTIGPDECVKYGSVGRLQELMEAKIVDPSTGEALPPGKQGELWLRGPTVMKGYVGNKEATAETLLPDGWLKTGDLCYFDADGCLYIVDRLKELIKYKGYQVPPAELERLLLSHPDIADAAVIPYPDEDAGEIPMAFVVRKPGSNISTSQIMDYVAKQVTPYKRIRRVAFVSAIPKNPSGKILRRELVQQATSRPSKL